MADILAVQQKLNQLGANPPLVADGLIGPKTRAAVIAFQKANGLVADGVVGPMTSAALGLDGTPPTHTGQGASLMGQVPPPSPRIQKYFEIAKNAAQQNGLTEKQFKYAFLVAKGEGGFGEGWGHPSASTIEKSQRYGLTGYEGQGSNNWGATQGQGDAGSFPHVDSHADGSLYVGNYRKWSTPEKGFLDVSRIILGGGTRKAVGAAEIKAAIEEGNLRKAVFAQHANGYFELNPEKYLSAVMTNNHSLWGMPEWGRVFDEDGVKTVGKGIAGVALASGLGWLGWRLLRAYVFKS